MTDKPGQAAKSVAVLGTGIMGSAMARNLLAAGLRTTVWDRSPQGTAMVAGAGGRPLRAAGRRPAGGDGPPQAPAMLAEAGAVVATSAAEAVNGAEVLI